jgi:histidyl-tRNA synthetase
MTEKITAVKGMNDVLPKESHLWEWLEGQVRSLMKSYAYQNIRTPIVEPTALFVRGLGEVTDIVEKEMYSFEDRLNGEQLTLRPEATAGVVRSVVENNLLYDAPRRLYYMGPMFRHERPQRGRYRQFHQMGAEAIGFAGPELDAELILMAHALWQQLGLKDVRLELNSLGQPEERAQHRQALIAYLEGHSHMLDEEAKRRLYSNPLRILDTKNPELQTLANEAPRLIDFLGKTSLAHFERLKAILDANAVPYTINPRLVRGMDYYNLSVFEFVTQSLGSQGTICGGGRYDYLVEELGGKSSPAVGWAFGVERVLELIRAQELVQSAHSIDCFALVPDAASFPVVFQAVESLRRLGLQVQMHSPAAANAKTAVEPEQGADHIPPVWEQMGSIKSQFKRADSSGAAYALIFGADELSKGAVTVKALRDGEGAQRIELLKDIAQWGKALQSSLYPNS